MILDLARDRDVSATGKADNHIKIIYGSFATSPARLHFP